MAFCSFDDSAALFDATPVENMFITEYMLRAPGDFVKVYLYGLMLCYHHAERMSLASMARDLDVAPEDVERAYRYWEREGLVRQTGDNPVCYTYYNLKQITLTRAEKPSEQLYNRHFTEEVERILAPQIINPSDFNIIFDWIDILKFPEEVVLMLLQIEKERSTNGNVSFKIADRVAQEWSKTGIRTVEDVERIVIIGRKRETELRKVLRELGQVRNPSEEEKKVYNKWIDDWGFTLDDVLQACRETLNGKPTIKYLDAILSRRYQIVKKGMTIKEEKQQYLFARSVFDGLGYVNFIPTNDDVNRINAWRLNGNPDELITLAVSIAHKNRDGGTLDDVSKLLERWKHQGFRTPDDVNQYNGYVNELNKQLEIVYDILGLEKKAGKQDRILLSTWIENMGMSMDLVKLAAQYAIGSAAPMKTMNRILSDWQRAGVRTPEAARAEHDSHVQKNAQPARTQDVMQRYTPEERKKTYSAAVLDFDEEDS